MNQTLSKIHNSTSSTSWHISTAQVKAKTRLHTSLRSVVQDSVCLPRPILLWEAEEMEEVEGMEGVGVEMEEVGGKAEMEVDSEKVEEA